MSGGIGGDRSAAEGTCGRAVGPVTGEDERQGVIECGIRSLIPVIWERISMTISLINNPKVM